MIDEAILKDVIVKYKKDFSEWWGINESYKWEAAKCFQENWDENAEDFAGMLNLSLSKTINLLENGYSYPLNRIEKYAQKEPEEVRSMFKDLYANDGRDLYKKIDAFKKRAIKLSIRYGKGEKDHYQNENAITTYLWLKFPEKYYIYKFSSVKSTAKTLESDYAFKAGNYAMNINNYVKLYDEINAALKKDTELVNLLKDQITKAKDKYYPDSELKTLTSDIGYYIDKNYSKGSDDWIPRNYTPGLTTEDWIELLADENVFRKSSLEIMLRMQDYGGQATCAQLSNEYGETPNFYDSESVGLAKRITKKTNCPIVKTNDEKFRYWPVLYVGKKAGKDVKGSYIWRLRDELSDALDKIDLSNIRLYVKYKNPYSQELITAKNIIFHGAPGTGKTYLARQIAADIVSEGATTVYADLLPEQKKQVEFVQFHPSYDYTDFVEGLRPRINADGTMGFELQDGIFKKFIAHARKNYEDSQKTSEAIEKESTVQEVMSEFFSELDSGAPTFETKNRSKFAVTGVDDKHVYISIPGNAISNKLILNLDQIKRMLESDKDFGEIKELTEFFGTAVASQAYSYVFALYEKIKEKMNKASKTSVEPVELKKYVFIIDEINRGEISKILGELFFSIDPDYRGKAGEVSTQYANLHSDPNEKFYVPDNVYIIGTMNDIDRSVDSFDFAMRRRFRFINLKADANSKMLDELDDKKTVAISKMTELNKAIAETDGLNENYQIGPAYFLKLKNLDPDKLWTDHLEPLLQDYVQGMYDEDNIMKQFASSYDYKSTEEKSDEESRDQDSQD